MGNAILYITNSQPEPKNKVCDNQFLLMLDDFIFENISFLNNCRISAYVAYMYPDFETFTEIQINVNFQAFTLHTQSYK